MDQGPGVMLNPFEGWWHIEPRDLRKWENQRQHIGILELDHMCLGEFMESSKSWSNRALEIKLIACLAVSSGILRSTARRKVTAS